MIARMLWVRALMREQKGETMKKKDIDEIMLEVATLTEDQKQKLLEWLRKKNGKK